MRQRQVRQQCLRRAVAPHTQSARARRQQQGGDREDLVHWRPIATCPQGRAQRSPEHTAASLDTPAAARASAARRTKSLASILTLQGAAAGVMVAVLHTRSQALLPCTAAARV